MKINKKVKKHGVKVSIVLFFLVTGVWYVYVSGASQTSETETELTGVVSNVMEEVTPMPEKEDTKEKEQGKEIVVHVCGAVRTPGVYVLSENSRLYEAVDLAGGFGEEAAPDYHNLARILQDGERIYIVSQEEVNLLTAKQQVDGEEGGQTKESLINLNTATVQQLTSLPGIGEAKAKDILAYREKVGKFVDIEELKNVSGIGEAMFEKIKDKVTVK